MSTRAQVRFATREDGVSFSEHPEKIHAQFYVGSDGYPEGLGLDIAMSLVKYDKLNNWEIEELHTRHGDLEYIYYVWQKPEANTWISIFEVNYTNDDCECCGMTKDNNNMTDKQLDSIAAKIVARMVKLKSMEDWFHHVSESSESWKVYEDLDLDEEAAAYGELAKLMTLMDICKQDEAYEKCAIIKNRITETKAIIRKYKK